MTLPAGELILDRYVIEGLIGVGGMGEVYRARHQTLGMPVAIKTVSGEASQELNARFTREAQLLARVRHPNVVSILDVGRTKSGIPCMVMEFLEGEALDRRLERRGAAPWREVRAIGLAVLKGLTAIHGAGIVHRDLKPANVLITKGSPSVVKIVDFGIAHTTDGSARKMTRTGSVVGTPAYMSPEQLVGGDLDARSDLYALGLLLYELAAGRLPFGDDPNGALQRLSSPVPPPAAPRPLPALPQEAVQAILATLAIDRDKRPASARAMIALLRGQREVDPLAEGNDGMGQGGGGRGTQHLQAAAAHARGTQAAGAQGLPPIPPHVTHAAQSPYPPQPPGTRAMPGQAPYPPQGTRAAPAAGAWPPPPPGTAAYPGMAPGIAHESYAMYDAPPAPTAYQPVQAAPPSRALIAARVPVSRLQQREEQRALAAVAAPGRAYSLGGGMWFAIVPAGSEPEAAEQAQRVCAGLVQRYGDTCRVVWAPASPQFALTPASLSGAAPLPGELAALLDHLLTL